jgi:ATP-dependent helicase HrpB
LLPIDLLLPEILASLQKHRNLVLTAEPGAGKTTRVPPALLSLDPQREVWVLEPRRLATRLAARRVAQELGQPLGQTVGYQVRLEEVSGPQTRLRFLTEGILNRRLFADPNLARVGLVVLDEFHERHLETDLAFALLRRLQLTSRPDLKLVVMSATLDADAVAEKLDDCPRLHAPGQLFPLTIRYRPASSAALEDQMVESARALLAEKRDSVILAFLPGTAEIRRTMRAMESLRVPVFPLYGDLSPAEQDAAVQASDRPKIICSTNVAESSVTIAGVNAVIDSGLARQAETSAWSGLPRLRVKKISQSSAKQRAGRAARLEPGRVIRLYPEADLLRRPAYDPPELERADLSGTLLALQHHGIALEQLPWLQPPTDVALQAARCLLGSLGALANGRLTDIGKKMSGFAVSTRLARLLVEAQTRGCLSTGAQVAAALSLGDRLPDQLHTDEPSDLLALLFTRNDARQRLARSLAGPHKDTAKQVDEALQICVLAAFPDRVAKRRHRHSDQWLLASGGAATQDKRSVVRLTEFAVAVDIEEREEQSQPLVRLMSAIQPDWLLDLMPDQVQEVDQLEWNRKEERVEQLSKMSFGQIALTENRQSPRDLDEAAKMVAHQAIQAGLERFVDQEIWEALQGRVRFAAELLAVPVDANQCAQAALSDLAYGVRSFAELKKQLSDGAFEAAFVAQLPEPLPQQLVKLAPERLMLAGGRKAKIHYPAGAPPYVASRLQDFFGMTESPQVGAGKVPLVVHLLAPNQRPVQMTQDLKGFWQRLYPTVRKELSRRYPRHQWPEDPFSSR